VEQEELAGVVKDLEELIQIIKQHSQVILILVVAAEEVQVKVRLVVLE
jgi:hypothetical protein